MGVVLKVLVKEGPLGIHFLKRWILTKQVTYIMAMLGTGILNNYHMLEGLGCWNFWIPFLHLPSHGQATRGLREGFICSYICLYLTTYCIRRVGGNMVQDHKWSYRDLILAAFYQQLRGSRHCTWAFASDSDLWILKRAAELNARHELTTDLVWALS